MVQRLTYKRRHAYNTKSNRVKIVKTPGGKLTFQYTAKPASKPKCGDCGAVLQGVPNTRPKNLRGMKKRERTVSRVYGGSRCGSCVRDRIVRSFLIQEQKIVKKVLKQRMAQEKKKNKKASR